MLITIQQATRRFATSSRNIVKASGRGQLTRHEVDGVVLFDIAELEKLFAVTLHEIPAAPTEPPPHPAAPTRRVVPTPDALDAAVARALR